MPRKKLSANNVRVLLEKENRRIDNFVRSNARIRVNVSGGSASAVAWKRVLDLVGAERVVPVFADTCSEDEDTYRFIQEVSDFLKQPLVRLQQFNPDGSPMDIWDCFDKHGMMRMPKAGNACKASVELKQKPLDNHLKQSGLKWIAVGYNFDEPERMKRLTEVRPSLQVVYPLTALPRLGACQIHEEVRSWGIEPPRVYQDGFVHNNCLGAGGCILSGLAQFAAVRKLKPGAFEYAKERSQAFFERTGFSVLRDQRGGEVKPYTLKQLDEEAGQGRDFGSRWMSNCGCMLPSPVKSGGVTVDFETRSRADLKKCGASRYARDESTIVLCLAYCLDGEIRLWTTGDEPPTQLFEAIADGVLVEAHNVGFERVIWRHVCHERMGWPDIPFDQWRCSLAACSRLTLPRGLADAGAALGLPIQKDDAGHKIMMRLSKPKKPSKKDPSEWDNTPEKFQKLYEYCQQDVRSEMAISEAIPELTPSELKVWQLDQRINLRGIAVDREALESAIKVVTQVYNGCCERIAALTGGTIETPKQVAAIRQWIHDNCGKEIPDLAAGTVKHWLADDTLPEPTREMLQIRQEASKASTAKLTSMLARCDEDGRVRGNLVYHGASTGRWAGAGIQIQNFPRGTLKANEIELVHRLLPSGDGRGLDLILGRPLDCISSSLRSMVCAAPGKRLLVCDFAQIEARVLAWIANQDDLLATFRAGDDVYVEMASKIYDTSPDEVNKDQRFIGKTAILGLGYGMGHRAFRDACKAMAGVEISLKFAKEVVSVYRKTNERIKKFWREINTAAVRAIETKQPHRVGRLQLTCDEDWLRIQLPSRRELFYCKPDVVDIRAPWSEGHIGEIYGDESIADELEELGIELGERVGLKWEECNLPKGAKGQLVKLDIRHNVEAKEPQYINQARYWGVDGTTRKWQRRRSYGGLWTENIVQAIARDFLVEAMLRVEQASYPIVATVHDEIICEVAEGHGSLDEFEQIMRLVPTWGAGCPIDVEGFEARRYRK